MIGGELNHGLVQLHYEVRAQLLVSLVHLEFDEPNQSLRRAYCRVIHDLESNQAAFISELYFGSCLREVKFKSLRLLGQTCKVLLLW